MPTLDVFRSDAFGTVSLTTAIDKLPFVPSKLNATFKKQGVTTTTVMVEERHGKLMIVPTAARGSMANVMSGKRRQARTFAVPHIPLNGTVLADDVQGVRAFGSEDEVEAVAELVNDKLADLKQALELTKEWHRIGAVKGIVLDADGSSVIYDFFDEFEIDPYTVEFDFSGTLPDASQDIKLKCAQIKRHVGDSLGATPFTGLMAICGKNMFDKLTSCAEVRKAYDRYQDSSFLRVAQARTDAGFEYADITWVEYRGTVGTTQFFDEDEIRIIPTGVPDLFTETYAPAPFMETVNTKGLPFYAKQKPLDWDLGVELHVETNPLMMCTRPAALTLVTDQAGSGSADD